MLAFDSMPITLTLRVSGEMRDQIDAARGEVPREKWMRRVLANALQELGQTSGRTPTAGPNATKGKAKAPDKSPLPTSARASEGGRGGVERVSPNGEGCSQHGTEHEEKAVMAGKKMMRCKVCGEMWPA